MKPDWYSDGFEIKSEPFDHNGLTAIPLFTEASLNAAIAEAEQRGRKAALEEAAKVCERDVAIGGMFAAAIRAKANEVKP